MPSPPGAPTSTYRWKKLRAKILAQRPFCEIKGPNCAGEANQVDHIKPWRHYPELAYEPSNLRPACGSCNSMMRERWKAKEREQANKANRHWESYTAPPSRKW